MKHQQTFTDLEYSSRKRITRREEFLDTMDSIIRGFEHQLDQLYKADAMDVDSDIRVMEQMLRRDTASANRDFDLGGAAAAQQAEEQ